MVGNWKILQALLQHQEFVADLEEISIYDLAGDRTRALVGSASGKCVLLVGRDIKSRKQN